MSSGTFSVALCLKIEQIRSTLLPVHTLPYLSLRYGIEGPIRKHVLIATVSHRIIPGKQYLGQARQLPEFPVFPHSSIHRENTYIRMYVCPRVLLSPAIEFENPKPRALHLHIAMHSSGQSFRACGGRSEGIRHC